MKLPVNPFTQAIKKGEKQIGLWVGYGSNFAAEIIAGAGYDWVVIDMEHSPNDYNSVMSQLQAFSDYPTTAIVRPDWNDTVKVKRLLDIGSNGLLFPMVQNVEEAEKAVAATRYPPRGVRGVSGSTRAAKFGRITDYFQRIEEETTIILQLETIEALNNAEEIAAVDGVHGVFFGPSDIAADLGKIGKPMDQEVWDHILPVAEKLIDKGIPVGTLVLDPAFSAKLLNDGFTFVACGMDTALLARSSEALLTSVKKDVK